MNEEDSQYAKKKLLIDLISCETTQIESERRRPGWTSWALLGALSTLAWLLVKQIPLENISWQNIGLLFLTATLTVEFVRSLPPFFATQSSHTAREPRFFYSSVFSVARFSLFVVLVHTFVLLVIATHLKQSITLLSKISLIVLLVGFLLTCASGILLSFLRFPQPRLQKGKLMTWSFIIISALYSMAIIGYWRALAKTVNTFDPSDIRVGALLVLIAYVLILMADLRTESPILPSLISIRRDLLLDKIDVNLAARQIDIALSGLKVEDVLQEYVGRLLDCFDVINHNFRQMLQIDEATENLRSELQTALDKEKAVSIKKAIEALDSERDRYAEAAGPLKDRYTEAWDSYNKKAGQIIKADRRAELAINEVTKKIAMANTETVKLLKTYEATMLKRIAELKAMLEAQGIKS